MKFEPQFSVEKSIEQKRPDKEITTTTDKVNLPEINLKLDSLPSRGIPYPAGSVIKYRPYTFGEVKKASGSTGTVADGYHLVLSGIETSFDKMELSAHDCLYIGFLRRISTLGTDKFKFTYKCEKCGSLNTEVLSLDSIEFIDLEIPKLPVSVDLNFGKASFDIFRVKHLFQFLKDKATEDIEAFAYQCLSEDPKDFLEKVESLTIAEADLLGEVDKLLEHGIKPMEFTCKKEIPVKRSKTNRKVICEHVNTVNVEGGDNLVQPFREDKKSHASRIHFG